MTLNQWALEIVRAVVYLSIGFGFAATMKWRQAEVKGVAVMVPTGEPNRPLLNKLAAMFLVVVGVLSIVSTGVAQYRQGNCNDDFRGTIAYRGQIVVEDGALRDRLDDLSNNEEAALRELVKALLVTPPLGDDQIRSKIAEVNSVIDENLRERADIKKKQQDLREKRNANPYPDPRC